MREESRRRYEHDIFAWETAVATIWTLLIVAFLIGATYDRLGRPELDPTSPAEASVTGSAADRSNEQAWSGGLLPVSHEELW